MNLIEVKDVSKFYERKDFFGNVSSMVTACNQVSFTIKNGETLGLVGESGSGKTTLGKIILGLEEPSKGEVIYNADIFQGEEKANQMQIIFQNSLSALNPWKPIQQSVMEPLMHYYPTQEAKKIAEEILALVGIDPKFQQRLPRSFSGGQRQRVGIARALVLKPRFIVCDEPVSALDVSIQAQIINLLQELQDSENLTYLFISHDLSIVRSIAHRVVVLYQGTVVEMGETEEIFNNPIHPYTKNLLAAIPVADPIKAREKIAARKRVEKDQFYITGQWVDVNEKHGVLMN